MNGEPVPGMSTQGQEHDREQVSRGSREQPGAILSDAARILPARKVPSSWRQHAPFAFWLIGAHRPARLVELGTHWGFSYFCFCQRAKSLRLPVRCAAVDTWSGDEHAGAYGEEVFGSVKSYNDLHFREFSSLMRMTFDEALPHFGDGSVDLLHIDGRHYYDDVKHDFESWTAKLSRKAIVLFHDTQVTQRGFGVHRYWNELKRHYPHFEFLHGYGLGVLGVGEDAADFPLLRIGNESEAANATRHHFETYGRLLDGEDPDGRRLPRNIACPCGSGRRLKNCHGLLPVAT
jgi:hypothetical protein